MNTDEFIRKAREIHLNKYDYTCVRYANTKTKITIICPLHGKFQQRPEQHLRGQGCKKCGVLARASKQSKSNKDFINRSIKVHGQKYDYSLVEYKNWYTPVKIICKKHGVFEQIPNNHIRGAGCKKCATEKQATNRVLSTRAFIKKAHKVHGNHYDYTDTSYVKAKKKVSIYCPVHGKFEQAPDKHLVGQGCPVCAYNNLSKQEDALFNYIAEFIPSMVKRDRTILNGQEIDIYLPEHKVAIEYNGLYWHSELFKSKNYHKEKTLLALENGVRLIHVWEDDWLFNQDCVKTWLKALLVNEDKTRIFARKTNIYFEVPVKLKDFFNSYHIQGYSSASKAIVLSIGNTIVAAALFNKTTDMWCMVRYLVHPSYYVVGGFNKIVKHFTRQVSKRFYTFADLSWVSSKSNVYLRSGMQVTSVLPPDYKYIYNGRRHHKFAFRHKKLASKLNNYDSSLSEHQNCLANNIYRVYDCGKIKYVN